MEDAPRFALRDRKPSEVPLAVIPAPAVPPWEHMPREPHLLDYLIILLTFLISLAIGLRFARRQKDTGRYFKASGSLPSWAITLLMVNRTRMASTISSSCCRLIFSFTVVAATVPP